MRFEQRARAARAPASSSRHSLGGDQQRDRVELPRPVHAARVAVDVVGDAVLAQQAVRGIPGLLQLRALHAPEPGEEGRPMGAARRASIISSWTLATVR